MALILTASHDNLQKMRVPARYMLMLGSITNAAQFDVLTMVKETTEKYLETI